MGFKFSLELFKSSLEIDFSFDNVCKSLFNVSWKRVVSANMSGWSVQGSVSEVVVFAWEHHLEELIVAESLVSIAVEENNKGVEFTFTDVINCVISKEVRQFSG